MYSFRADGMRGNTLRIQKNTMYSYGLKNARRIQRIRKGIRCILKPLGGIQTTREYNIEYIKNTSAIHCILQPTYNTSGIQAEYAQNTSTSMYSQNEILHKGRNRRAYARFLPLLACLSLGPASSEYMYSTFAQNTMRIHKNTAYS